MPLLLAAQVARAAAVLALAAQPLLLVVQILAAVVGPLRVEPLAAPAS
jgi:hypothetical protein